MLALVAVFLTLVNLRVLLAQSHHRAPPVNDARKRSTIPPPAEGQFSLSPSGVDFSLKLNLEGNKHLSGQRSEEDSSAQLVKKYFRLIFGYRSLTHLVSLDFRS